MYIVHVWGWVGDAGIFNLPMFTCIYTQGKITVRGKCRVTLLLATRKGQARNPWLHVNEHGKLVVFTKVMA